MLDSLDGFLPHFPHNVCSWNILLDQPDTSAPIPILALRNVKPRTYDSLLTPK